MNAIGIILLTLAAIFLIRQLIVCWQNGDFGPSDHEQAEKLVDEIYKNYNLPEDKRGDMYQCVMSGLHAGMSAQAIGIRLCFEFDITSDKRRQI